MKIIHIFSILISCNVVCNIALSIISPFYPTFANQRGISEDYIGLIFSAHPIGSMISSLILGKVITNNNRAILMNIGIIIQGIGLLVFGILSYIHEKALLIVLSFVARLFGGFGASMFMTPFYAYIPLLYPTSVEQKVAVAEVSTSLGFLIGPALGSFLFSIGGFTFPFFFFTGACFILGGILPCFYQTLKFKESILETIIEPIPESDATLLQKATNHNQKSIIDENFKISYLEIGLQYPIVATFIINATSMSVWTYYYPTFSTYLEQTYQIHSDKTGYYMVGNALTFALGAMVISKVKSYQKFYMFFGLVFTAYLQYYYGPDYEFTHLDKDIWITISAYTITGFTAAFPYILTIPLFNTILNIYYPRYPFQCSNISSALFTSSLAVGQLIGPIIGGNVAKQYGYEKSASYFGCFILIVALFFAPYLFYTKLKRLK